MLYIGTQKYLAILFYHAYIFQKEKKLMELIGNAILKKNCADTLFTRIKGSGVLKDIFSSVLLSLKLTFF